MLCIDFAKVADMHEESTGKRGKVIEEGNVLVRIHTYMYMYRLWTGEFAVNVWMDT